MKTVKKPIWLLVIAIVSTFMFNSCTKEGSLSQELNDDLNAISAKGKNADIILSPTGDASGISDANAIENALSMLPAGGVLLLDNGIYYVDRTIVVPEGFNGTLKGISKDDSEIVGVGDSGNPFSIFNDKSSILYFPDPTGSVLVSSLTISLSAGFVTNTPIPGAGLNLGDFIIVIMDNNNVNTRFQNIRLTGTAEVPGPSSFLINQPGRGIRVNGSESSFPSLTSGGTHVVSNSEISKIGVVATEHVGFKDAAIQITDNTFNDIKQILAYFLDGSDVLIKKNNFNASALGTIVVTQQGQPIAGNTNFVTIRQNEVTTDGLFAIEIGGINTLGNADFNVLVQNNTLNNTGGGILPSINCIDIGIGNDNAVVKNNVLLGNAVNAISQRSDYGSFKNNDLTNFNATAFDYVLFGDNNEIKGVGTSTVDDQGSGNSIK